MECHCMTDLFQAQGVTWGVLHQCAFGMKDPVDNLPYKKATCLAHNFAEDQLAPLWKRCPNEKFPTGHSRTHTHI